MDKNIENPMIFLMPKVKLPVVKAGSFTYLQDIDLISVEYDFCYAHDPNQKFNTILQGNIIFYLNKLWGISLFKHIFLRGKVNFPPKTKIISRICIHW